jgi:hypothetical protein
MISVSSSLKQNAMKQGETPYSLALHVDLFQLLIW